MGRLSVFVHLLGGKSMETFVESALEQEEYAADLAKRLNAAPRGFFVLNDIVFHTNAIAGFDVDTA